MLRYPGMARAQEPTSDAVRALTRAIFVVGVGRSGTTLMQGLLDNHSELFVLPEESKARTWHREADPVGRLYETSAYGKTFPATADAKREFERRLRERLPGPVGVREALLAVVEATAWAHPPAPGATAWVEKTPKHLRNTTELFNVFGTETRVICMIRDPRSVYASRARRWGKKGGRDVRSFARRWSIDDMLTARFERFPGFLVVRYEDLLREPEITMKTVASHLGIAFEPGLLVPSRLGEPRQAGSSFGEIGTALSMAPLHRYRSDLDVESVAALEALIGPRMVRRGYARDHPDARSGWRFVIEASTFRMGLRERWGARL